MSKLQSRGSIAAAAVTVVLLWSTPVRAQVGGHHGCPGEPGGLLTLGSGVFPYEIADQAKAERHLDRAQAKFVRDSERGNPAAVDRDARRIHNLRNRIAIDEWMIRKIQCNNPGIYPYPRCIDPLTLSVIGQATGQFPGR